MHAWGLGVATNNILEALAMLKGLIIVESNEIRKIVIEDSIVIIKALHYRILSSSLPLANLYQ
jgi:ribonuclease HI